MNSRRIVSDLRDDVFLY